MEKIEEKVVKVQTVAEQIIEAPVETVVVARYGNSMVRGLQHSDSLVKTGVDGYLATRYRGGKYLHRTDVQGWIDSLGPGAEFYFVFKGRDR